MRQRGNQAEAGSMSTTASRLTGGILAATLDPRAAVSTLAGFAAALCLACGPSRRSSSVPQGATAASGVAAVAAATSPATATPEVTGPVYRIGGDVTAPLLISKTAFHDWPKAQRTRHAILGSIFIMELVVDEAGHIRSVKTLRAPRIEPPWPEFEDDIREAISRWRYTPATKDGKPVAVYLTVTIEFLWG